MPAFRPVFITLLWVLFADSIATAQSVRIELPRQGTYRVGQFMSAVVNADDPSARDATITLRASGALPTTIAMSGRARTVAPVLMLSPEARELSWSGAGEGSIALQAMNDDQPAGSGPTGSLAGIEAYSPTLSWQPDASARTRRTTMLCAALTSIALIASAVLIRSRGIALIAMIGVVALAALGIEIWRRQIPRIWRAQGQIVVMNSDDTTQVDSWQYLAARTTTPATVELLDSTWPVFIDLQHARSLDASLQVDAATGRITLKCTLKPDMKLAICSRRVTESTGASSSTRPLSAPPTSPMAALAQRLYSNRNSAIVGQGDVTWIDDQTIRWPSIILRNETSTSR